MIPLLAALFAAALLPLIAGLVLFGWNSIRVLAICVAAALLTEAACRGVSRRAVPWAREQAVLMGVLMAATMPPTVRWTAPLLAVVVAVAFGQILSGGVGNYLWHPVAVGRVLVQLLFSDELSPRQWPILAAGRLLWGNLSHARPLPELATWSSRPLPSGVDAWLVVRPADVLQQAVPATPGQAPSEALSALLRDHLPPWIDTLTGVAGGAVGEAGALAVLLAGLILMWRGLLPWTLALGGVLAAGLLAIVLPVSIGSPALDSSLWFPGFTFAQGVPVGLAYAVYHLSAGEFLFVLLLLAPDPTSSPLTHRGHLLFGLIIGAATMLLRIGVGLPGAGYWALLLANTAVPAINHLTRRRVFGT